MAQPFTPAPIQTPVTAKDIATLPWILYFQQWDRMVSSTGTFVFSGQINASGLPTSDAGLNSGDLWVDPAASYVVKRVP